MTDTKRLAEGRTPTPHYRVECPVWHSPGFMYVRGGIVWRCKSCRGGTTHFESKEEALRKWEELEKEES